MKKKVAGQAFTTGILVKRWANKLGLGLKFILADFFSYNNLPLNLICKVSKELGILKREMAGAEGPYLLWNFYRMPRFLLNADRKIVALD